MITEIICHASRAVNKALNRDDFIAAERKKHSAAQAGFDSAVASALKEQLAKKGT